jgi:Kdo2-lipid IVA lauroyltransferase/acyltransferase
MEPARIARGDPPAAPLPRRARAFISGTAMASDPPQPVPDQASRKKRGSLGTPRRRIRSDDDLRSDRLTALLFRIFVWCLMLLPYRARIPLAGFLVARVVAPLAGYTARIRENLALVMPETDSVEVRRMMRAVPDNVGRTIAEIWSGHEFLAQVRDLPLTGPGVAALEAAHRAGRPVILSTAHFGNYDVARAALIARGYPVGALYRPMDNAKFNKRYLRAISAIGTPLFPRGRDGMGKMIRHLRDGGMLGILTDQHMRTADRFRFFDHPARTATSAADLALKYDAAIIPVFAVRQPDGLAFRIIVEDPVARGTAAEMTQAINDGIERIVRQHPDQWFWIHRRWK